MFAVMRTLHCVSIEAYAEDTEDSCSVSPTSQHEESYSSPTNSTQNVDELLQVSKTYGSKSYQLHTAYHSRRFSVSKEERRNQKYFQRFCFLRGETCNQSQKGSMFNSSRIIESSQVRSLISD